MMPQFQYSITSRCKVAINNQLLQLQEESPSSTAGTDCHKVGPTTTAELTVAHDDPQVSNEHAAVETEVAYSGSNWYH